MREENKEYICDIKLLDGVVALSRPKEELIRCKDCKSYQPRYSEGNEMLGRCQNLNSNFVTGRGYCYWAERKEE